MLYLVSKGSYSDYSVVGVFSTREKAQNYIDEYAKSEKYSEMNEIEEYELDAEADKVSRPTYEALIHVSDGEVTLLGEKLRFAGPNARTASLFSHATDPRIQDSWKGPRDHFIAVESFVSHEHAAKVAVEKRQEYLRDPKARVWVIND